MYVFRVSFFLPYFQNGFFVRQGSNIWWGHETDRQGSHRCRIPSKFDVSATGIQWKTSRTRTQPKVWKTNAVVFCLSLGKWRECHLSIPLWRFPELCTSGRIPICYVFLRDHNKHIVWLNGHHNSVGRHCWSVGAVVHSNTIDPGHLYIVLP